MAYGNSPVKIPKVAGKITFRKTTDRTYVLYETGRVYNPVKKTNTPQRAMIGLQIRNAPALMLPNENYEKYFGKDGEEKMTAKERTAAENYEATSNDFWMLSCMFDQLYFEFQIQAHRNPHFVVNAYKIQRINKVYWRSKEPQGLGNYVELQFASPDDFFAYPSGSGVYTWQPINDLQVMLKLRLLPDERTEIKITYNRKWDFNLDSELRIPEQYSELFITALTHKLATTFPRLSTEQVALLKQDLDDMIKNVKTSTRAVKYLSRKPSIPGVNRAAFLSGSMFLPG